MALCTSGLSGFLLCARMRLPLPISSGLGAAGALHGLGVGQGVGGCRATLLPSPHATRTKPSFCERCSLGAGAFPGHREAARARNEQRPPGIPGGNSGMEEIVGVLEEILGIRIGVSSFLPPQAACPEPMSHSVSQKLSQKKGRKEKGEQQKAQLSSWELTHGAQGRPAWPLPVARPDSWGLAPAQHLHWAGCIWKHFQHFLNDPAVSRAGPAGVTVRDAQQGDADTT